MVAVDTQRVTQSNYRPIITNEPDIRKLSVNELLVHSSYQREQTPQFNNWVNKTIKSFDPDLLGVLMVANENGKYFVWDGQGRLEVLQQLGIANAWCQITVADEQRQAELFGLQTNRRSLTWTDRHKARVVEGDQTALDIDLIADTYGYSVGFGHNRIRAVSALYWIYNRGGSELLGDVLRTTSICWADSESGTSDRAMRGLGFFYHAYPPNIVDRAEVLDVFSTVSPTQVLGETAQNVKGSAGSNNHTEFARLLMKAFNKRMGRKLHSKPITEK